MIEGNFIPFNFLGLDESISSLGSSRVVILPVPFERTVSFGRGTSKGPFSIIYASRSLELYDDELDCEPCTLGIHTISELDCHSFDPSHMVEMVGKVCSRLLDNDKFIITLGGEHSITIGTVKGHKSKFDRFSVLNLDAHCDLRDSYESTPFNHACAMRRVIDQGIPVVEVGIRSYSKEEAEFIRGRSDIKIFHALDIMGSKREGWIEEVISHLLPRVYLSVDLDVFDPSFVPGTGTPEPGGLKWYDVLGLVRAVFRNREVIGMDVVELSPISGANSSDILAAKLIYKAIGYKFKNGL